MGDLLPGGTGTAYLHLLGRGYSGAPIPPGGHWANRHGLHPDRNEECAVHAPRRRCQCVDRAGFQCCAHMDAEDLLCTECREQCSVEFPEPAFPGRSTSRDRRATSC